MVIRNRVQAFFQKLTTTPEPVATTNLERKQQLLAHHVRLVARGLSNGLFVYGSKGGLGKTIVILKTLANEGIKPVVLNSHVTPLALFSSLQANADSIVVLDDADALFRNLAALGILRSALWGQVGSRRLVTYNSSQLDIPNRFEFSGAMILIANVIPKRNHAFDAVLSRIDQFELDATNDEVLELMRRMASHGYEELNADQCLEVVDFISGFSTTRELSLRLLEPGFRKVIYAQQAAIDWRDLVRTQLDELGKGRATEDHTREFDMAALRKAMEQFPNSVQQQLEAWCQETQRSRATFFRLKKLVQKEQAKPNSDQSNGAAAN